MKKLYVITFLAVFICTFIMCHKATDFPDSGYDERMSGGEATTLDASSKAFSNVVDGLNARNGEVHILGDATFGQTFVAPPSPIFSGLGPIFNNISCINCHRNDAEGIPTAGLSNSGLLCRLSLPGIDLFGGPLEIPGFGTQLQDQAVVGIRPEANVDISYSFLPVAYPDGTVVTLRQPAYSLKNPYIPLPASYLLSPRLAPPLVGEGFLENIPESTILSFVDANDANGDGITGKANYVHDYFTNKTELGRFGLKANTPTLLTQVATAYQQDMGITSYVFPKESAFTQTQMSGMTSDVNVELPDSLINYVVYYIKTLAVPARRNVTDADVVLGKALFAQANCTGCHRTTMQSGIDLTLPQISNQRIHPYTDLLLHEMGTGLADNRPDYLASGTQWRTKPLWGIGLLTAANGTPYYLHDGRARTVEEAILWHGGEAARSKQAFMRMGITDRARLLKFILSL